MRLRFRRAAALRKRFFWLGLSRSESFIVLEARAVGEFARRDFVAAFELNEFHAQRGIVTARYMHVGVACADCAWYLLTNLRCGCRDGSRSCGTRPYGRSGCDRQIRLGGRAPNRALLSAELRECAGPRLKAADAVVDFLCGEQPINSAVFFFQRGRGSCLRTILWRWRDRAACEPAERVDDQRSTCFC